MPDKVKGTSAPRCKLCQKRHWGLCPRVYDPKQFLDKVHARHTSETEHLAEELDAEVKPKRKVKK